MRSTRSLVLPAAVGALVLLAGCSGDTDSESTPTGEATAPVEDPAETEGPATASRDDCLEGEWTSDLEAIREATLSAPGMAALDPEVEVSGESSVTFADGVMTTEYDQQTTEVAMALQGQEVISTSTYNGTMTASYAVADGTIEVTDVDMSGVQIDSATTVNGEAIEVPDLDDLDTRGVNLGVTSAYTCEGDELSLTPQVEGADGFTQVLTRR
ncbi:hypothetical protein J4G33_14620 [Actinotalea sp. BY-33]|uniref:Lipoprotein n=1 Tax=Actinotalea soli TaxID=2819234 RepID=A0A939LS25_9CELL|nr:hypothetical protein [Actinotalea soli]MBO1753043.1 hypothetical protein [Actinotalea soli]